MNVFASLHQMISRLGQRGSQDEAGPQNHAWSISSRLAAAPESLLNAAPSELAGLIMEAKQLHPEMASAANRRDVTERSQHELNAQPSATGVVPNAAWVAHAYPLQQVKVHLQGTKHSDRASVIKQLAEVMARLEAGEEIGELHDDDFGYRFEVTPASPGPSFFDHPSGVY